MTQCILRGRFQPAFDDVKPGGAVALCAPMGMGKSALLNALVAGAPGSVICRGRDIRSVGDLRERLAAAVGAPWLIVDDADRADPAALEELVRTMTEGLHPSLRIAVAGRSPRLLNPGALAASGRVRVVGTSDLAFTLAEAEQIAISRGVAFEPDDLTDLLHVTDGWPLALTWIVRDAAERQPYLVGAFERWSERNADLMLEYVASDSCPDAMLRRRFMESIAAGGASSEPVLAKLERAGCPIVRTRTRLTPFRLLGRLVIDAAVQPKAKSLLEPLSVTLLGRFQCRIGTNDVVFGRRRDQSVLVFLALAADGSATRAELKKAFWPGLPAAVASQGVRSTLCRLRRAFAAIVGDDVDRYFTSRGVVTLDLQHVHVDARRFREHVRCAQLDEAVGERAGRMRHLRAAERIYGGSLLASESVDAALTSRVAEYVGMFETVCSGLAEERRTPVRAPAPPASVPARLLLGSLTAIRTNG